MNEETQQFKIGDVVQIKGDGQEGVWEVKYVVKWGDNGTRACLVPLTGQLWLPVEQLKLFEL